MAIWSYVTVPTEKNAAQSPKTMQTQENNDRGHVETVENKKHRAKDLKDESCYMDRELMP